jgi:hypothetical protein
MFKIRLEFLDKTRKTGNHPSEMDGLKLLPAILIEVESIALACYNELDCISIVYISIY